MASSGHRVTTISRPSVGNNGDDRHWIRVKLARWLLRIHDGSAHPSPNSDAVKVVCVSDTHNTTPSVEPGDILLHSGDLSQYGTFKEIQRQLDWLNTLPHMYKIVVAGNHDLLLDKAFVNRYPDRELNKSGSSARDLDWGSIIYLENSSVQIVCHTRTLQVFGSPDTPRCGNFAFQYDPPENFWAGRVPTGTDILVTHGPPALHLDGNKGCRSLLQELWRARPTLVVFGHIHHARGYETMTLAPSQRLFEAICLDAKSWLKLPSLQWAVCAERWWNQSSFETISLINAACHNKQSYIVAEI